VQFALAVQEAKRIEQAQPDAIQRVIGYQTIEHGTTFQTEDQLIIGGDELGGVPQDSGRSAASLSRERPASRY
jgi:hypothetical protein